MADSFQLLLLCCVITSWILLLLVMLLLLLLLPGSLGSAWDCTLARTGLVKPSRLRSFHVTTHVSRTMVCLCAPLKQVLLWGLQSTLQEALRQ
jgi:hypothetical protein